MLIALANKAVTSLAITAMILITPRGEVGVHAAESDPRGSNLSPAPGSTGAAASVSE